MCRNFSDVFTNATTENCRTKTTSEIKKMDSDYFLITPRIYLQINLFFSTNKNYLDLAIVRDNRKWYKKPNTACTNPPITL